MSAGRFGYAIPIGLSADSETGNISEKDDFSGGVSRSWGGLSRKSFTVPAKTRIYGFSRRVVFCIV